MTYLRWLLLAVSIVFYRVWFPDGPPPLSIRLDYEFLVIALVGLYQGVTVGTIAGWCLGFLGSAYDPEILGWSSLLGAVLGWTVGMLKERLFLEYPLSRWLVLWGVLLIVKSAYMLAAVGMDPGLWISSFFAGALASAGLTATAGLVVSLLWERAKPRLRGASSDALTEDSR